MHYGKLLGLGVVIYAVVFLVWTAFLTYGFVDGYLPFILNIAVLLVVAFVAGIELRLVHWADVLPYSIGWAVIVALFDAVLAVPFAGWDIYSDWHVWLGYLLVIIVPLFAPAYSVWRRGAVIT